MRCPVGFLTTPLSEAHAGVECRLSPGCTRVPDSGRLEFRLCSIHGRPSDEGTAQAGASQVRQAEGAILEQQPSLRLGIQCRVVIRSLDLALNVDTLISTIHDYVLVRE